MPVMQAKAAFITTARRPVRKAALFAACLTLAACEGEVETAPGAVSEGEAAALEKAAEMLDETRMPEGALPDIEPPADTTSATPQDTSQMTGDNGG
jgi:hypothetical protein